MTKIRYRKYIPQINFFSSQQQIFSIYQIDANRFLDRCFSVQLFIYGIFFGLSPRFMSLALTIGLEHLAYERRLRDLRLLSSEKRKVKWVLSDVYKYLVKEDKTRLFSEASSDRTRGNEC